MSALYPQSPFAIKAQYIENIKKQAVIQWQQ